MGTDGRRAGQERRQGQAHTLSLSKAKAPYPLTPDGRYFVVRGRLWRSSNPALLPADREALVRELMAARRAVAVARRTKDEAEESAAHAAVDIAKRALGERGPVWWTDGAPDLNRHMARTTVYADWYAALPTKTVSG